MRTIDSFSISLFIAVALAACTINVGDRQPETRMTETPAEEPQGKEYTAAYICPMHCAGSGSDEPGQCPVCGMDYVKNTADSTAH